MKQEKEKEKEEEDEAQEKKMVDKVQRAQHKPVYDENEEGQKMRKRAHEVKDAQSEANFGKVWEVALSPFATGTELAECHCWSRRATMKNGGSDEETTRSADQGKQVG